jgi:hypothetical protein
VDLVNLDDNGTNSAQFAVGDGSAPGYNFVISREAAALFKWSSRVVNSAFWYERLPLPLLNRNVILSLAVTRMNPDLIVTARVLDKADPTTVLFAHSVVDTPSSDPTLDRSQYEAVAGVDLQDLVPDAAERPPTTFCVYLGVSQITDGKQPTPTATFANLEMLTYEVPPLSIARAVQLTWPAAGGVNYTVEGAPTVQGPWLPVQPAAMPGMRQMNLPLSGPGQFFRLVEAP